MANAFLIDPTLSLAQNALQGLSFRQEVISQNIANVDTPGYQAQEVDFETTLQNALDSSGSLPLTVTDDRHVLGVMSEGENMYEISLREGGSTRADGNNVDIDQELEQMTETGITYQALITGVTKKLNLLKTIAEK